MTPLKTPQEVTVGITLCREAWETAQRLPESIEKLRFIHKAFPHALTGTRGLYIGWDDRNKAFSVGDAGGFLTLIPLNCLPFLIATLRAEEENQGAFRALITGKERPQVKKPKPQLLPKQLTLSDLGI